MTALNTKNTRNVSTVLILISALIASLSFQFFFIVPHIPWPLDFLKFFQIAAELSPSSIVPKKTECYLQDIQKILFL